MSGLWLISYIALWILVILLTVIVLGLVRQLGMMYLRLGPENNILTTHEGLELGSPAPDFYGIDVLHTKEISLADLKGQSSILVFVSPSCHSCEELMPYIAAFQRLWDGKVNLTLFSQADPQSTLGLVKAQNLKIPVIADSTGAISAAYQVRATPFAYHLDKSGLVLRGGIINNIEGLEALLKDVSPSEPEVDPPNPQRQTVEVS